MTKTSKDHIAQGFTVNGVKIAGLILNDSDNEGNGMS